MFSAHVKVSTVCFCLYVVHYTAAWKLTLRHPSLKESIIILCIFWEGRKRIVAAILEQTTKASIKPLKLGGCYTVFSQFLTVTGERIRSSSMNSSYVKSQAQ